MPARVRLEYQTDRGPAWLSFTVSGSPTAEAAKFNSNLSQGLALTLCGDDGAIRVVPAHSVIGITVEAAGGDDA